jgi:hypothetical protein
VLGIISAEGSQGAIQVFDHFWQGQGKLVIWHAVSLFSGVNAGSEHQGSQGEYEPQDESACRSVIQVGQTPWCCFCLVGVLGDFEGTCVGLDAVRNGEGEGTVGGCLLSWIWG